MKIANPSNLALGWIPWKITPPELHAAFFLKGTFAIRPGQPATLLEKQPFVTAPLHYGDDPAASVRYDGDFAPFKPLTDLLLVGTCHAPEGGPVPILTATFGVGSFTKTLRVAGDRRWSGSRPSDPEPFTRIPIRYENAFGGPGYAPNPVGKGIDKIALPNIEDPARPVRSPGDRPPPAGFGPISWLWKARTDKVGTFKEKWLKERWPWYPEDFDWTYWNGAPPDQQMRENFLRGDEEMYFENLHPVHAKFRASLPGIRPRLFVKKQTRVSREFLEIALRLDTLWADLDEERLVLVWRGALAVEHADLREVVQVLMASEPLDSEPKSLPYYRDHLLLLQAKELEAAMPEPEPEEVPARPRKNWADWKKAFEQSMAKMEEELKAIREKAAALLPKLDPRLPPPGDPLTMEELGRLHIEKVEAARKSLPEADIPAELPPPMEAPAPLGPPKRRSRPEPWTRERVERHAAAKGSFAEQDLADLDLSSLDLSALDFASAILARAGLAATNLSGAVLTRANLEEANLGGAVLVAADLTDADFRRAVLARADLSRANLERADFQNANLKEAVLRGAVGPDASFFGADVSGADFRGGRFKAADFSEARAVKTVFAGADLTEVGFMGGAGREVDFRGATLTGFRGGNFADLYRSDFTRASARGSVWETVILAGTNFSWADLEGSNFGNANLEGAVFFGANLRRGRLHEANGRRADFSNCNLFRATLLGADLTDADMRGSNLYEVDFWNAVTQGTAFENSNLHGANFARS